MERKDFIHSSTRIRSLESKLLTKEQFDRMIESNSLEDAIKVLQETSYSDVFNKIDRPEDYDKAIYNELTNLYETVMDLSNNRDVVDIVSLKYDAHNMKVILKDHVMGTDNTNLIYPMGRIKVSNVAEQAEKGDRKGIDKMLTRARRPFRPEDLALIRDTLPTEHQSAVFWQNAAEFYGVSE